MGHAVDGHRALDLQRLFEPGGGVLLAPEISARAGAEAIGRRDRLDVDRHWDESAGVVSGDRAHDADELEPCCRITGSPTESKAPLVVAHAVGEVEVREPQT